MENQNDDILMKVRSSRACIGAGYRLFTGNFKRIFRYSWLAALILAAVGSFFTTLIVGKFPELVMGLLSPADVPLPEGALQFLLLMAVSGFVLFWLFPLFFSYGFSQLRQHKQTGTIPYPAKLLDLDKPILWRTLKCYLCMVLLMVVISCALAAVAGMTMMWGADVLSRWAGMILYLTVYLAVLLLTIPLYYVATRYILDESQGFWNTLRLGYKTGMGHYGYLFAITFIDLMTALIAAAVTTLPSTILFSANLQAQTGVLNGDPLGMPSYMTWLTFIVFLIAQFIRAYIMLSVIFPLYYMYGSIETQEEEKKNTLEKML